MIRLSTLAIVLAFAAVDFESPALAQSNRVPPVPNAAHRYTAGPLYDVVPQSARSGYSDDPSMTGGGSIGYNQMIYNW